jgi:hypothetical protein
MKEQPTVHGSIFFLLKKFVDEVMPAGSWEELLKKAGLNETSFELTHAYPLEAIGAIVKAASETTGLPVETLKEKFGEHLVPHLFHMYKHYLAPEWKTYEVLVNTETVMHGAVRKLNSTAHPPILNVTKVGNELLMVDYYSKRKMGSLAVGIIKGIAKYYKEEQQVTVEPTTDPDSERVQIKVHFTSALRATV